MSPGHAVPLCRCLPDFVVSTKATTTCRRERIPTAAESAIRARFVRDSFHSLITGFPRPGNAVIRQCAVVDLASFAPSGLLHRGSLLSSVSSIGSRRFLCVGAPWVAHALLAREEGIWRRRRGGPERVGISRSIRVPDACLLKGVACDGNSIGTSKISKHCPVAIPPAQRLPGMVEAGILRERDAHGSRRCFARICKS
jgi:hypothetical protein